MHKKILYENEELDVIYKGKCSNFPKEMKAHSTAIRRLRGRTDVQWEACMYYVTDLDGDEFKIAVERYGPIHKDFEWKKEKGQVNINKE